MKFERFDADVNEVLYTIEVENALLKEAPGLFDEAEQILDELVNSQNPVTRATLEVKNTRGTDKKPYEVKTITHTKSGPVTTSMMGEDPSVILREAFEALEGENNSLIGS